jgi:tetratricopeptide (TPR) repeat protein
MSEPETAELVACFRWRGAAALAEEAEHYARAAENVMARGEQLGARVVAWHAASFAVAFPVDAVESVVELCTGHEILALGFSVGVAEGPLGTLGGAVGRPSFAWGQALVTSWALARVARAGEVLLDPELTAVQTAQLLVRGARIGVLGNARVRGLRLDLRHPWQPARGFPSLALVRSPYLGREPECPAPGMLGLVSGRRGVGGTRWLEQLAAKERERRTLWLRPHLGEALGALRRALARAAEAAPELDPERASSLESLLAGEGLDVDASAEVLTALLGREGASGLVLIDDAEHIDADSLEAVAKACEGGAFAVVARVVDALSLPESLRSLPKAFDVGLEPLSGDMAAELVTQLTSTGLRAAEAAPWAKRGGGLPLGIVAALTEALESGELVAQHDAMVPRLAPGRSSIHPPPALFSRRIRRWDPRVRLALGALAVLGGDSDEEDVTAVLALVKAEQPEETMLHALEAADLVRRDGVRVALTSATLRAALSDELSDAERARLHRAAAAVLAASDMPVSSAAAAVHSMLGGDVDRALPLARRGAGALRASGMEETAAALDEFSGGGDLEPVRLRGLFAGARAERVGLQRSDVPPPSLKSPHPALATVDRPSQRPSADEAAHRFLQALRHGDHAAMEVLAAELRDDESQHAVASRLEGMASLARGQVAEALRRLRQAKESAKNLSISDKSRAALALGVALAAAGRGTEALLEGLEALARAREATDARGELACARFLARLSHSAGNAESEARWQALAAARVQA